MTFVVEVETKDDEKRIVGKTTGETIFTTKMEAEDVANMFRHTLDCDASVERRKEPTPWAGSVRTVGDTEILAEG